MATPQQTQNRKRIAAALLTVSLAGAAVWKASEGDGPVVKTPEGVEVHVPYVPTKGDVPTIGHGSTRYEDGTRVKMTDKPITRERAAELAKNLRNADEKLFIASIPGVELYQGEFDLYNDFVGQYGIGNWNKSTVRRKLLVGDYKAACEGLLSWRFQDGRDCKLPQNWGPQGCKGVWTRQQARHQKCMALQ